MKTTFVSACLIGAAIAGPRNLSRLSNSPKFVNFMANNNKHYTNTNELNQRAGLFATAENEVRNLNAKSQRSGKWNAARFETNFLADLTETEKQGMFGLDMSILNDPSKRTKLYNRGPYRLGEVSRATTVDHAADGFMHAVKEQGQCGSCYAFAANTALEGYIAKRDNASPIRLSEQHLVDCTLKNNDYNFSLFGKDYGLGGCKGGWMSTCWRFQNDHGVMLDSDYPYTSGPTRVETKCNHQASKIIGKVKNWGKIETQDGLQGVKDKLATHPMTIAIDAGRGAFQYYKDGVITADQECGNNINHAVVLVGYTDGSGPSPGPDPEPEPPVPEEEVCDVTKWWYSCEGGEEDNDRRQLPDADGLENYWKIQNSWSTRWGDKGFVRFEITEGSGICGMNSWVEWVEM